MKIVTVLSDINDLGFNSFLNFSCKSCCIDLIVLQYSQKYTTHRIKDYLLYKYLRTISYNEIIFFTDGQDTFFTTNSDEIELRFHELNTPLVFSAEVNCWPDDKLKNRYPINNHHFKYLNTGGFIGSAGFIRKMLEKYPILTTAMGSYLNSNQYYWHHVYLDNQNTIKIDHDCRIFYNTSVNLDIHNFLKYETYKEYQDLYETETIRLRKELIIINNRLFNTITNRYVCHLHFPGPMGKRVMPYILETLLRKEVGTDEKQTNIGEINEL